ncbi:MAG: fluoride efflux transporter CrcB [Microcystaceae cyanobacterium]
MNLGQFLIVFLGGGVGSVGRYWINLLIVNRWEGAFPLGTFIVNLVGCFLIGLLAGIAEKISPHPYITLLLITGFCGGFTTFSSFSLENNLLTKNADYLVSFVYTFMSLFWGFSLTFLALYMVRKF